ncbi:hypothetical protein [Vibrio sp. 10N.261.51.F12]|uniref:hypothetical protein n=1 Tax=Vibrio sp. 10N.261.51.F12 TaxID=3229679 RepID=UPI0035523F05
MGFDIDSYAAIAFAMALLSIWKTYSGPALAAMLSYSYPEMVLFNVLPALMAGYFGWWLGPRLFNRVTNKQRVIFRPRLRRFLRMWHRYGQLCMALLAPLLIGIPIYTLLSKRLKQGAVRTFSLLTLSILLWSGMSYFGFLYLNFGAYIELETLIPSTIHTWLQ